MFHDGSTALVSLMLNAGLIKHHVACTDREKGFNDEDDKHYDDDLEDNEGDEGDDGENGDDDGDDDHHDHDHDQDNAGQNNTEL